MKFPSDLNPCTFFAQLVYNLLYNASGLGDAYLKKKKGNKSVECVSGQVSLIFMMFVFSCDFIYT